MLRAYLESDGVAHVHGAGGFDPKAVVLDEVVSTAYGAEALYRLAGAPERIAGKLLATIDAFEGSEGAPSRPGFAGSRRSVSIDGGRLRRLDVHVYGSDLAAVIAGLASAGVDWVLTGSVAATAWGVPESPRDIDITPALDPDNLERLAGLLEAWQARPIYHPGWWQSPSPDEIAAWRPRPATEAQLDHLLSTPHGLFDVVPRVAGTYEALIDRAVAIDACGTRIRVAHPADLIATLRPEKRARHARRGAALERAREPYFMISERLGFRTWAAGDRELARQLWGDPAVTRFIAAMPLDEEAIAARLARELESQERAGLSYWPLFCRERGALVGCCGLRPRPDRGEPEIGVHIGSSHWRRGYAREAMTAVIAYAFDRLGARALFAGHNPGNEASRRLLDSLGFVYTHDEPYPATGLEHPSYRLVR